MRKAPRLRLELSEYSRACAYLTRRSILSGCGGFFCAPRMPPTPRSRTFCENFAKFLPTTSNQIKKNDRLWRCDSFRQKIVKIGTILAIFEPFEVPKFRTPVFGEFGRSSQDLCESDYDLLKSRDDRLNSSKSGMWIFRFVV